MTFSIFTASVMLLVPLFGFLGCAPSCSKSSSATLSQAPNNVRLTEKKESLAQKKEAAEKLVRKKIVFLGDSLTAGYGLEQTESYPAKIQAYFDRDNLAWEVINAGVSGDTSKGGAERLEWSFQSKPAAVFVALGANDGLRGIQVEETTKNINFIVEQSTSLGAKVFLAGMKLPKNYGSSNADAFQSLFFNISKKYSAPLYPFLIEGVALKPELNLPDGIHPNALGAQKIATAVYEFLKPLLDQL